jgi:Cyclic nucleotide-binding domain
LVSAYALFTINEYSVWIAVLVYAYAHGGATAAGVVSVAQLAPAALCAPFMAVVADRHPERLLLSGLGAQTGGLSLAAVAVDRHWASILVYAGAVVASTSLTAVRPAQTALLPSLARTPNELTAANVALSWVEALAVAAAGLWTAALLTAGIGQVLAAAALLVLAANWLIAVLPVSEPVFTGAAECDDAGSSVWTEFQAGARIAGRAPGVRTLVGLLAAEDVVVGGLDVLFVVIAFRVLHRPESWVGYLNSAYGLGGVVAGAATVLLIGKRLPRPIVVAALVLGVSLAAVSFAPGAAVTVGLLTIVGAARAVMDMASRTLLQRSVAPDVLGRVFGLVEGFSMATLAVGSITVPLLIRLGGSTAALVCIGLVLPVVVAASARHLSTLDRGIPIPVTEIALLRSVSLFARLPASTLEAIARSLTSITLRPGDVLIREGEVGDRYYVVADGRLTVTQAMVTLREVGRGAGLGEIALLRDIPRTATVTADTDCRLFMLSRDVFVSAVTGHAPSRRMAESVVAERLR